MVIHDLDDLGTPPFQETAILIIHDYPRWIDDDDDGDDGCGDGGGGGGGDDVGIVGTLLMHVDLVKHV